MRYIGGKSRLAKEISGVILENTTERETYYEPFMGGGATLAKIAPNFKKIYASDNHPDLMLMWKAVLDGWEPPTKINEYQYQWLKDSWPSPVRGFVGFAGSFGGKWFGGYARGNTTKGDPRNYLAESARAIEKIRLALEGLDITLACKSYDRWDPIPGSVVYCDPPYANSQGYSTGDFDSAAFWKKMDEWSQTSKVFVSEYQAPEGWTEVWRKDHRRNLALPDQGRPVTVERLFTR